jgi:hypothetical protein
MVGDVTMETKVTTVKQCNGYFLLNKRRKVYKALLSVTPCIP